MTDEQIRDKMRSWLDNAGQDAMDKLFNVLRADELGEPRTGESEKLFEVGLKQLFSDYKHAMQAIDSGAFG